MTIMKFLKWLLVLIIILPIAVWDLSCELYKELQREKHA